MPGDEISRRALTHVDKSGKASMVDVGGKSETLRQATDQKGRCSICRENKWNHGCKTNTIFDSSLSFVVFEQCIS